MSEKSNSQPAIARSTAIISSGTFSSRVLGLVRDMVIAHLFPKFVSDAFFVAFRLPNMLRELLAEGAMNAGFIPVFSDYRTTRTPEETQEFAAAAIGAMAAVLMVVSALGVVFAPAVVRFITLEFGPPNDKLLLAIRLARVMFPYILLIGTATLFMAILNSYNRFFSSAYAPMILNLMMIVCAYVFRNSFDEPIFALALGVMIGGLLQVALQIPFLRTIGIPLRVRWNPGHPGLRLVFLLLLPTLFGQAVREINVIVDTMLAWYLGEGMVSALYYAYRLMHLPLGVFGLAIATAILPLLSRSASAGDMQDLKATLSYGLRSVFFVMLPATVGLVVLREPIVRLLFEHGSFDSIATDNTAFALMFYSLGLFAFAGARVLAFTFYSMKNTRTPVVIATVAMVTNVILNLLLMIPLRQGGLALASSISSTVNLALLWFFLQKKIGKFDARRIVISGMQILGLSTVMGLCTYILAIICQHATDTTALGGRIVHVFVPIAGGMVVYLGLAFALGLEEAQEIRRAWGKKGTNTTGDAS